MKKIFYILSIPALFFVSSCGDGKDTNSETVETVKDTTVIATTINMDEYREFDMSPHGLDAIIFIPKTYHKEEDEDGNEKDKFDQPEITHNEGEAKWVIRMPGHKDRYWRMEIDDWGDEIQTIEMAKVAHQNNANIFNYIYLEEGEGYMRYSKVLKGDNTTMDEKDAASMPNHHFYSVKNIDGSYIVLQSYKMDDFREISVKEMMVAANATKAL